MRTLLQVTDAPEHNSISPFTLSGPDRPSAIDYRSKDLLGNAELIATLRVVLDNAPPTTSISPSSPPFPATTRFTLFATDGGSGVGRTEYHIDGGVWTPYAGPFTLQVGAHVIGYRSVDNLGNVESERTVLVPTETAPPEFNWKPSVATTFALILLVVGAWSARRSPGKDRRARRAALKGAVVFALPFIVLEGVTGVVSLTTGLLSIPPLLGVGTLVDLAILTAGVATSVYGGGRMARRRPEGTEARIR